MCDRNTEACHQAQNMCHDIDKNNVNWYGILLRVADQYSQSRSDNIIPNPAPLMPRSWLSRAAVAPTCLWQQSRVLVLLVLPSPTVPSCLRLSVFRSVLFRRRDRGLLVLLPALGDIGGQGIVGIRSAEKSLDGEENRPDLKGRRPVIFEQRC